MIRSYCLHWVCLLLVTMTSASALAAGPRALPEGKLPHDKRLGTLKDLNGYFPFTPQQSPTDWMLRAEQLRRQMLVANGLWPMPTKTPHKAVIHGKVDREEYTVEKVFLQSYPGHFVTGSLYRPKGKSGRLPGVLCPHGHWANGRFHDHGEAALKRELDSGGEKFASGRHPLQARCVHLARLGCVVFHYDMLGYADSVQLAHRPGAREQMNTGENWGFFSPQAELRLQTMMGLQTYNSVRALDWFSELPDVDPQRIAVTGASGGGTQTFMLCAVDPRPAVAFPAVMVSTAMQGGCTCENCSYLRVNTGNVEIAGLFAPKPLGMSAADDWTKEMETKGLPELKQHYAMLGSPENVMAKYFPFPHNYNFVSRALMYGWLNKHLKLGPGEPPAERDFRPLSVAEMSVWDESHPKPPAGDDYERSLLKWMTEDASSQVAALEPHDFNSLAKYREVIGGALETMIGRGLPKAGAIEYESTLKADRGSYIEFVGRLRYLSQEEELPIAFMYPKDWKGKVVAWLDKEGKSVLYDADGSPSRISRKFLDEGASVVGVDLLYQGEFQLDGQPLTHARLLQSGRDTWKAYAGYTFGYNHPVFAQRVHDILSVLSFCRNHEQQPREVHLVALGETAPLAAAAGALAGDTLDGLALDTAGFRFEKLTAIDEPHFLPGIVKYGDLPALIALNAPRKLWLAGEGRQTPEAVAAAYRALGKPDQVNVYTGDAATTVDEVLKWLSPQ